MPQWHKLHQTLIESGADPAQVEPLRNAGLTHAIVTHYRDTLEKDAFPLEKALRESRDKIIAHNEAVDRSTLQKPTWGEALSLVNYAKDFVSTIGYGYLSTIFGQDSQDYILTTPARRTSLALRRLLEAANIAPRRA